MTEIVSNGKGKLIEQNKSVIVAADLPFGEKFVKMIAETIFVPKISAYKIGPESVLRKGLEHVILQIKRCSGEDVRIIYDHQKAGNDIPQFGEKFMAQLVGKSEEELSRELDSAATLGVDAAILFPFAGKKTQEEWTKAAFKFGLVPIVGGEMTHPNFLWSEGGYIHDDAPELIYRRAAQQGVINFVVPGNKLEKIEKYRLILEKELGVGNFVLYAPGFISQGGDITKAGKVAGDLWHAIIGSAIYNADNMHEAAMQVTAQI